MTKPIDYGTVRHDDGTDVSLTQQAYLNGDGIKSWYEAAGKDAAGNTYRIQWAIIDPECNDEMDACNWEHPSEVKLIERA